MKIKATTEALARAASRRPWVTIGAWLGVLITAFLLTVTLLGDVLTTEEGVITSNPESERGYALLEERWGIPLTPPARRSLSVPGCLR